MGHEPRWTRLELLKRGGATALALSSGSALLAACGSDDGDGASTGGSAGGRVGQLDYLSWEGYDFPDAAVPSMKAWKAANGVELKSSYIATNEDIPAKIQGGGGAGLDLITYGAQNTALYEELGFLAPMDPDKLPNLGNLIPFFAGDLENFWVRPDGTRIGVPMMWGVAALSYDSSVVAKAPDTYDVIFEPAYEGKVAVTDSVHDVFGLVSAILGIDYSKMTTERFAQVTEYTERALAQSRGLSQSFGDAAGKIASGEAVFAFPGFGAMNTYAADAGKETVRLAVPREGSFAFCDAYAIPTTSDNVEGAHAWINQGLDTKVNAEKTNYLSDGTVCTGSVPLLKPEVASLYPYDGLEAYLERATWVVNPPVQSDEFVTLAQANDAWQKLKAQA